MGENANLIWLLLGAISILLQSHLSFEQGVQKLNQKNVEKVDINARNVCVFTFSWSLTFSSHKKKISNFIKLKFLNDKIYSYTICKRNYLAHGNLAKLVFLLILFYVIGFFKTAQLFCVCQFLSWEKIKNTKSQPKYLNEVSEKK